MKKFLIACVLFCAAFVFVYEAYAMRITLKRVTFEGPKRAEVLTIINGKDKPVTYRIGWKNLKMTERESLVAMEEGEAFPPGLQPAEDMVRFAPRRFTVGPRSSQQIRLMVRYPANLQDGEYRSHLWIRPESDPPKISATEEQIQSNRRGVAMTLLAGVTMPVIVRKGNLSVTGNIANLSATSSEGFIRTNFDLTREGSKSLYGDLRFVCNPGASEYELWIVRGIAVYTELNSRNLKHKIAKKQDKPACQTLAIRFYEKVQFDDKPTELTFEATTAVQ